MLETIQKLEAEGLLDLDQAAAPFKQHKSTVGRWCRNGAKGQSGEIVRLEHIKLPGRVLTSKQAVGRFLAAISAPATG